MLNDLVSSKCIAIGELLLIFASFASLAEFETVPIRWQAHFYRLQLPLPPDLVADQVLVLEVMNLLSACVDVALSAMDLPQTSWGWEMFGATNFFRWTAANVHIK